MALVLRAKQDGFALPAAIAPGSPWADLTKTGDTFYSHNLVDNFQVSYDGYLKDSAYLYANGRDLKDPMLSPIYGDLHGFPPTILTSGTRDLFLSLTVRVHRKLRQAGVDAALQVFEGLRTPNTQLIRMRPKRARRSRKSRASLMLTWRVERILDASGQSSARRARSWCRSRGFRERSAHGSGRGSRAMRQAYSGSSYFRRAD